MATNSLFIFETVIRFHETDAAGRLFFAHQLKLVHDAYEAFLESCGLPLATIIRDRPYDLPIVHTDADYLAPLFAGDRVRIALSVERIGETSFTLNYELMDTADRTVGRARTVHVSVDSKSGQKVSLPAEIRALLQR